MTMLPEHLRTRLNLWRWSTLIGYFGLLIVLLNWFTWISPPDRFPRGFLLILLVVPLMFPLQGILKGRPYTHSWACFLALPYFAIGVDVAFNNSADRLLALAVIVFSLLLFFGCAYFARYERLRLKLLDESTQNQGTSE